MRNVIVLVLSLSISSGAVAAWTKASESGAGTGYVNRDTIARSGDNVKMWELTDYRVAPDRTDSYRSVKRQFEFDCKAKRLRVLSVTAYSGQMGKGEIVNAATDVGSWVSVKPSSVGHILWTIACNTRSKIV